MTQPDHPTAYRTADMLTAHHAAAGKHNYLLAKTMTLMHAGSATEQDLASAERTGTVGTSFYISPGQASLQYCKSQGNLI